MKKIIITLLISLGVGCSFAFIIYKNIDKEVEVAINNDNIITFFQVGVFKNEGNATNFMQKFNSSIIIKDGDYYRLIIAILENQESILKLQDYFESLGIEYYLKKENINNEKFLKKLREYEKLLLSSSSETYHTINKNILKLYEEEGHK